jgi:hypothetical protein
VRTCAPSRMTPPNHPLFWIVLSKRRAATPPALVSDARSVVGRPAKKTDGLATADTNGTRSIREECAPRASTSGLPRSASRAPAGRRIPIGMCGEAVQ